MVLEAVELAERLRPEQRSGGSSHEQAKAKELALVALPGSQQHRDRSPGPCPMYRQPEAGARLSPQRADHDIQAVRIHDVVRVVELEELTPRQRRRGVAVAVVSEVPIVGVYPDPWVARLELTRDRQRTIARAVVGNDQLELAEGLRQHTFDRCGEVVFTVVSGQQHADDRRGHESL